MIHLNAETLTANLFFPKDSGKPDPIYKLASNIFVSAIIDLATVLNEDPPKYSKWRLETIDFFTDYDSVPFKFWCSVVKVNPNKARNTILQFLEVPIESLVECRAVVVSKCRRKLKNINVVGKI